MKKTLTTLALAGSLLFGNAQTPDCDVTYSPIGIYKQQRSYNTEKLCGLTYITLGGGYSNFLSNGMIKTSIEQPYRSFFHGFIGLGTGIYLKALHKQRQLKLRLEDPCNYKRKKFLNGKSKLYSNISLLSSLGLLTYSVIKKDKITSPLGFFTLGFGLSIR